MAWIARYRYSPQSSSLGTCVSCRASSMARGWKPKAWRRIGSQASGGSPEKSNHSIPPGWRNKRGSFSSGTSRRMAPLRSRWSRRIIDDRPPEGDHRQDDRQARGEDIPRGRRQQTGDDLTEDQRAGQGQQADQPLTVSTHRDSSCGSLDGFEVVPRDQPAAPGGVLSAAAFLIIFDNQGMALIAAAAASVQEAPDGAGLQAQPAALDAFHLELADVGDDPRGRPID